SQPAAPDQSAAHGGAGSPVAGGLVTATGSAIACRWLDSQPATRPGRTGATIAPGPGPLAGDRSRNPDHAAFRGTDESGSGWPGRAGTGHGEQATRPRHAPAAQAARGRGRDGVSAMNDFSAREPGSAEALLGELVDEYLDRLHRGERPAIEDDALRYP